jgi:hypothetical protein
MRTFAVFGFVPTLLWLGFVLATSFLKAPPKFRSSGVSRLQALSVGRVVFRALSLIESVFLLILIGEIPSDSSRVRMTVLEVTKALGLVVLIKFQLLDSPL